MQRIQPTARACKPGPRLPLPVRTPCFYPSEHYRSQFSTSRPWGKRQARNAVAGPPGGIRSSVRRARTCPGASAGSPFVRKSYASRATTPPAELAETALSRTSACPRVKDGLAYLASYAQKRPRGRHARRAKDTPWVSRRLSRPRRALEDFVRPVGDQTPTATPRTTPPRAGGGAPIGLGRPLGVSPPPQLRVRPNDFSWSTAPAPAARPGLLDHWLPERRSWR